MIRILIRTPFRHVFRAKDIWLMGHENYYLDPINDKDEIKHIISNLFPYKDYIYLDPETIPGEIKQELKEEEGFFQYGQVPPSYDAPVSPPLIDESTLLQPPVEPKPNSYIPQNPSQSQQTSQESQELVIDDSDKKEEEIHKEEPVGTSIYSKEEEKETRADVLNQMHWKKLKDIAEQYNVDYTNKDEVVSKILSIEFD